MYVFIGNFYTFSGKVDLKWFESWGFFRLFVNKWGSLNWKKYFGASKFNVKVLSILYKSRDLYMIYIGILLLAYFEIMYVYNEEVWH